MTENQSDVPKILATEPRMQDQLENDQPIEVYDEQNIHDLEDCLCLSKDHEMAIKTFAPTIIQKDGQNLLDPKGLGKGGNHLSADLPQAMGAPKAGLSGELRSQNSSGGQQNNTQNNRNSSGNA